MPKQPDLNAEDILPPEVLELIPEQYRGRRIYFPKTSRRQRKQKHLLARALHAQGKSIRGIARELGYTPRNVRVIIRKG